METGRRQVGAFLRHQPTSKIGQFIMQGQDTACTRVGTVVDLLGEKLQSGDSFRLEAGIVPE